MRAPCTLRWKIISATERRWRWALRVSISLRHLAYTSRIEPVREAASSACAAWA